MKMIFPDILRLEDWYYVYLNTSSSGRGSLLPPIQMPTSLTFCSLASTPSLECGEADHSNMERRNSSGTLLSPEVEGSGENDGFYMLKKDSQRRATLAKVFANDGSKICDVWLKKVREKNHGETVLTIDHMRMLMEGLKSYLTEQSFSVVEMTLNRLKEQMNFDSTFINQLQLSIYFFQESVNEVLRLHPIKPHWMFALDSLVRSCVQAVIQVLSPELSEDITNHSSPSSVNSTKSSKTNEVYDVRDQNLLRTENVRLLQELAESQKQYHNVLRQLIDGHQQQTDILRNICCCQKRHQETVNEDERLRNWLEGLEINEDAKRIILAEGYTLDEVLYQISYDDFLQIGLKGATRFRIWRAIQQLRNEDPSIRINLNGVTLDETGTI